MSRYLRILLGVLAINIFFLVGNYQFHGLYLAFFLSGPIFLCGLAIGASGSLKQLHLCFAISAFLAFLLSANILLYPEWFLDGNVLAGAFLIIVTPLIGWSFGRLEIPTLRLNALMFLNMFNAFQYFAVQSLAGRNIAYRLAVLVFLISLYGILNFRRPTGKFQKHFFVLFAANLAFTFLFFVLIFINGSRGGIVVLLLMLLVQYLKPRSLLHAVMVALRYLRFKTSYLLAAAAMPVLAYMAVFLIEQISPRAYLLFTYFIDRESVLAISSGTQDRSEWYAYLADPLGSLLSVDVFHSPNVAWGDHPHNIILDAAGNLGVIFAIAAIASAILAFRLLRSGRRSARIAYLPLVVLTVFFSSMLSGTVWDYYMVFAGLIFATPLQPEAHRF